MEFHNWKQTSATVVLLLFLRLGTESLAQGTMSVNLLPYGPSAPPLEGYAVITLPSTNCNVLFMPVLFQIVINSDQVSVDTGRFYGESLAWAFSLGTPINQGGMLYFSGSTMLSNNQISEILAGKANLEVFNETVFTTYLTGAIFAVPEPPIGYLFVFGLGIVLPGIGRLFRC